MELSLLFQYPKIAPKSKPTSTIISTTEKLQNAQKTQNKLTSKFTVQQQSPLDNRKWISRRATAATRGRISTNILSFSARVTGTFGTRDKRLEVPFINNNLLYEMCLYLNKDHNQTRGVPKIDFFEKKTWYFVPTELALPPPTRRLGEKKGSDR